ncbi:unnamed protein product, partial [Linum tenue]
SSSPPTLAFGLQGFWASVSPPLLLALVFEGFENLGGEGLRRNKGGHRSLGRRLGDEKAKATMKKNSDQSPSSFLRQTAAATHLPTTASTAGSHSFPAASAQSRDTSVRRQSEGNLPQNPTGPGASPIY